MQKYIKTYCDYFGYVEDEFIPSELSGAEASEVHHISFRSRLGGDNIENLMALTRGEHEEAHGGKYTQKFLQEKHNQFMKMHENRTKTSVNK